MALEDGNRPRSWATPTSSSRLSETGPEFALKGFQTGHEAASGGRSSSALEAQRVGPLSRRIALRPRQKQLNNHR